MKEIETIEIGGIEDFLREMVPQLGFQRIPVYRGQASDRWKLFPPLFREAVARTEFSSWSELEAAFLIGLKQRGLGALGYEPATELEWLAQGAHHGLPTRFSNWTENALVALGLLYGKAGTLNMADLSQKILLVENETIVNLTALFFLIGFGIKSAVFPLYFWLPSSYHTPRCCLPKSLHNGTI